MPRPSLDDYYLAMLPLVASRATCPRRQVAAILVDSKGRLVSCGYNGNPAGMEHCIDKPCPGSPVLDGPRDQCHAVHAETNAVLYAMHSRLAPTTIYVSTTPCFACSKLLVSAGIKRVVAASTYKYDNAGVALLQAAGVELDVL